MVLRCSRTLAFALILVPATLAPGEALAQSLPDVAPALPRDDPEYEISPTFVGPVAITLEGNARVEYDDNIFALPEDKVGDAVFLASANAGFAVGTGNLTARLDSSVAIRRFADHSIQDTDAARFEGNLVYQPRATETFSLSASWERAVEDRGDPEARRSPALGPRTLDVSSMVAAYERSGGRLQLNLQAEATKFDATAAIDDDRDFTVYGGSAKLGLRVGGRMYATVSAFASQRDFRLAFSPNGINRDATIYGARAGVQFAPGGMLEGSLSAGIFRNNPEDPALNARTGLSVDGLLVYRPTRRMALIFDASRGDVATFRGGASGRTDTTVRATWEQEIRHNLYSSVSVGYRDSAFVDSGTDEQTVIGRGKLEFVLNRNVSLFGEVSYGSRNSDLPTEEFDRVRGSVGFRMRF